MKAVVVERPGDVEALQFVERETPKITERELLVRVRATSLNRADLMQREGKYMPPLGASSVLGLDVAGVVEEVGAEWQAEFQPGDRIFGLLDGGGYAQYAAIPGERAMRIPDSLSFEEAAAIPEVFLTAYQTLFWIGKLERGETLLIHAGASGVGTAAIQLANQADATPIVTVGSEEKKDISLQLGARFAFNYHDGPFLSEVQNSTHGQGVHVVLDLVGAPYFEQNIDVLQVDGRLVLIGAMGGTRCDSFSLAKLLGKRIQVTGTTLRSRSDEYKKQLTQEFSSFALPLFQAKEIHPVIDSIFPWEEVRQAHQYMEENKNMGKIILQIKEG